MIYLSLETHYSHALHNTFHTTSFGMEVIDLVLCRNFRRISPHLLLVSSDTCHNFPHIEKGPIFYYYILYSISRALTVPSANSLPMRFYGTQHSLQYMIGINKANIRVSCSPSTQNSIPNRTVNTVPPYFLSVFSVGVSLIWGTSPGGVFVVAKS